MDGCDHDDWHIGKSFFRPLQQLRPVHLVHHQVGEHELEFLTGFKQRQCLDTGASLTAAVVRAAQHGRDNLADRLFVVDYEYPFLWHGELSVRPILQQH